MRNSEYIPRIQITTFLSKITYSESIVDEVFINQLNFNNAIKASTNIINDKTFSIYLNNKNIINFKKTDFNILTQKHTVHIQSIIEFLFERYSIMPYHFRSKYIKSYFYIAP